MRQRLAILFFLPCLYLAGRSVPFVRAQVGPTILAPADPEAAGGRRDAKTAARAKAAREAAQQPAAGNAAVGAQAAPDATTAAAPAPKLDKWGDAHSIARVKHPIISWPKLLLLLLLILIWVMSADWVNRDSQTYNLGYGKWNPIIFFPFFVVMLLFTFPVIVGLANFWVGFAAMCIAYLATYIPYVLTH